MESFEFKTKTPIRKIKDPNLQEYVLADMMISTQNKKQMSSWINLMKINSNIHYDNDNEKCYIYLIESMRCFNKKEYNRAMMNAVNSIMTAKRDNMVLLRALSFKCRILMELEHYQEAINHYEIALDLAKERKHYFCIVNCYLNISKCNVELNNMKTARKYFTITTQLYDQYKENMQENIDKFWDAESKIPYNRKNAKEVVNALEIFENEIIEKHIISLREEIDEKNYIPPPETSIDNLTPMDYISNNTSLTFLSSFCEIVKNRTFKVKVVETIPEGEILLTEKPYVSEMGFPHIQCNNCQLFIKYLIPCLKCKFIHYCSKKCREEDYTFHKYECAGYLCCLFPLLNVSLELRLLLRGLIQMRRDLWPLNNFRKCSKAKTLFENLKYSSKDMNSDYYALFNLAPSLTSFATKELAAIISNSVRLMVYLVNEEKLLRDFFSELTNMSKPEIEIFLVALIIRHTAQIRVHSRRICYELPDLNKVCEEDIKKSVKPKKSNEIELNPEPIIRMDQTFEKLFYKTSAEGERKVVDLSEGNIKISSHIQKFILRSNLMKTIEMDLLEKNFREMLSRKKAKMTFRNLIHSCLQGACEAPEVKNEINLTQKTNNAILTYISKYINQVLIFPQPEDGFYSQILNALFVNVLFIPNSCKGANCNMRISMSGVLTIKTAIPINMNDCIVLKDESPDAQANPEKELACNCNTCMNHVALTMRSTVQTCHQCGSPVSKNLKCFICFESLQNLLYFTQYLTNFQNKAVLSSENSDDDILKIFTVSFDILSQFYNYNDYFLYQNRICYCKMLSNIIKKSAGTQDIMDDKSTALVLELIDLINSCLWTLHFNTSRPSPTLLIEYKAIIGICMDVIYTLFETYKIFSDEIKKGLVNLFSTTYDLIMKTKSMTEVLFMENLSHDISLMTFLAYLHQIKIRLYMRCQFNYQNLIGRHNFESIERKQLRKIVNMGERSTYDDTEDESIASQDPLYYDLEISSDSEGTLCSGSFLYYESGLDQVPSLIKPNEYGEYTIVMPLQSNEVILSRRILCSGPGEENISNEIYIIDPKSINKNYIFNENNVSDVHTENSKFELTELAEKKFHEKNFILHNTKSQTQVSEDFNKFQVKMPLADTVSKSQIITGALEDILIQTAPDIGENPTESTNSSNLIKDLRTNENVCHILKKVSSDNTANTKEKMREAKKYNENRQFGFQNTRKQLSPKTQEKQIIAEIVSEVFEKCVKKHTDYCSEISNNNDYDYYLNSMTNESDFLGVNKCPSAISIQTNPEDLNILPITESRDDESKVNQIKKAEVQIPDVNKILLDLTQSEKRRKRKRKRNNVSKCHFINHMDMCKKTSVQYFRKNYVSSEWNHAETIQFLKNEFLAATEQIQEQKVFKSYNVENILNNVTDNQKKRKDGLFPDIIERKIIKCCPRSQIKSTTAIDSVCETVFVDEQSVNLNKDCECASASKIILSSEERLIPEFHDSELFNIPTIDENYDIIDLNCETLKRKDTNNSMNNKHIMKTQMQNFKSEKSVTESEKDVKNDIHFKYTFENWNEIIDEVTATADNNSKTNIKNSVFLPVEDISIGENGGKINISELKRYKDDYAQTDSQISADYMATNFFINQKSQTSISIDILINNEQVYRFTPNIREGPNKMEIVLQNIDGKLKIKDLPSNPPGTVYNSIFPGENIVTRAGNASLTNAYAVSENRLDNVRPDDGKISNIVGMSKLYDDKLIKKNHDNLLSEGIEDKSKATIMTVGAWPNPFEEMNVIPPFDFRRGVSYANAISMARRKKENQKYKECDREYNHTFRTRCINTSRNMDSFRDNYSVNMRESGHHFDYGFNQPEIRANHSVYNDNIIADNNRDNNNHVNRGRSNNRRPFNNNWRFNYRRNSGSPPRKQYLDNNHNHPNM